MTASANVPVSSTTLAAARLAAEVMALFTPCDEQEEGFAVIHLHGFIEAYDAVRDTGLDPHAFVEAMLIASPQEKILDNARRIIDEAYQQKEAKKK